MHIIQKSNVLNIKRKTSGSVTRGLLSPNDCKRRESQKNKPKRKGDVTYLTVCGEQGDVLPQDACSLPLALEVSHEGVCKAIPSAWPTSLTRGSFPLDRLRPRTQAPPRQTVASPAQRDMTNTRR